MPQTVSIDVGKQRLVHAAPKDDGGNPGTKNGPVTWQSSDSSIVTVTPGSDELVPTIKGIAVGSASVTASAQAIPFGPLVQTSFTVNVNGLPFTHFDFTFDPEF